MIESVVFLRKEVSKILNVTPATIANREESGLYPEPKRGSNNYRIYNLRDILKLQLLTDNAINIKPILSILYDKGYTNQKEIARAIEDIIDLKMEME